MGIFRQLTTERRVGVVGLFAAGKTALLTSLVNHLVTHDPGRFRLGTRPTGATLRKFRELPPTPGWERFPYQAHRDALVHHGKWPHKTRDTCEFACQFERSDWALSDLVVRLLDLPGERLADAPMLGRDYAGWSDQWLARLDTDQTLRHVAAAFVGRLTNPDSTADELSGSFRLGLATAIAPPYYQPAVSPSTFLLDPSGRLARGETPEQIAEGRFTGLAGAEFCPLPEYFRAKRPDLVQLFEAHYDEYREKVVTPTWASLRSCHSLVVVIDVLHLLSAGVHATNDTRRLLQDLMRALEPGESLLHYYSRRLLELVPPELRLPTLPAIHKLAFVVPKIDLVHPRDRDRLTHLLKKFVGPLAHDHDGVRSEFFAVSAIRSTRALALDDPGRTLVGVPYRDAAGARLAPGPEARFAPSIPPEEWPANWGVGGYHFPEVYPVMPAYHSYPPDHINLDRLADFLLDS